MNDNREGGLRERTQFPWTEWGSLVSAPIEAGAEVAS